MSGWAWGADITAPPKPSAQTQILLTTMEEEAKREDERWREVMEHLDLLFARVGDIDRNQQKVESQFAMTNKVIEQMLLDQQLMSKQIDATGKAVAQLTLEQRHPRRGLPTSPTSSETSEEQGFAQHTSGQNTFHNQYRNNRDSQHINQEYFLMIS